MSIASNLFTRQTRDRNAARHTLHWQRPGGSSRFAFSENNEPWLFHPAERLLTSDTLIYRIRAGDLGLRQQQRRFCRCFGRWRRRPPRPASAEILKAPPCRTNPIFC